jgi:hypothetical protein
LYKKPLSTESDRIPFGDWVVDAGAGILTFYKPIDLDAPPFIKFYRYIGKKGLPEQQKIKQDTEEYLIEKVEIHIKQLFIMKIKCFIQNLTNQQKKQL